MSIDLAKDFPFLMQGHTGRSATSLSLREVAATIRMQESTKVCWFIVSHKRPCDDAYMHGMKMNSAQLTQVISSLEAAGHAASA